MPGWKWEGFFLENFPHTLPNTESIARQAESNWVHDKVGEMNGKFGKGQSDKWESGKQITWLP